ncbi:hypothetical protein EIP91_002898 [Steccherinum ochraceum]|uniref:F-box domain-containing protein n=1 Tax=Steccherinum ochraceum TaxID=92696 RepID=A0A4R0RTI1_9APHY|nr:hypothetical protein EIP91_002898 [Steccherinum ochraceum]
MNGVMTMSATTTEQFRRPAKLWRRLTPITEVLNEAAITVQLTEDLMLVQKEIPLNRYRIQVPRDENARLGYTSRVQEVEALLWKKKKQPARTWADLDAAILKVIFEATIPPSAFLDPSIQHGPNSLWCKAMFMRKSLVLVCKSWKRVALPFLYGEVVLRRAGQVLAFARTVQGSYLRSPIAHLVRSISCVCDVPIPLRHLVGRCAAIIFELCPRITAVTFSPEFIGLYHITERDQWQDEDDNCFLMALQSAAHHIHELKFRSYSLFTDKAPHAPETLPVSILPSFWSLKILHLPINEQPWPLEYPSFLHFRSLEELTMVFNVTAYAESQIRVLSSWLLPVLRQTSIRFACRSKVTCQHDIRRALPIFFGKHGMKLTHLDIAPCPSISCRCSPKPCDEEHDVWYPTIMSIVGLCPFVTHIVLPFDDDDIRVAVDRHPDLRIDVWGSSASGMLHNNPHWQNYRVLSEAFVDFPDAVRILDDTSSELARLETTVHRIYNHCILKTPFFIAAPAPMFTGSKDFSPRGYYGDLATLQPWQSGYPRFWDKQMIYYASLEDDSLSDADTSEIHVPSDDTMVDMEDVLEEGMQHLMIGGSTYRGSDASSESSDDSTNGDEASAEGTEYWANSSGGEEWSDDEEMMEDSDGGVNRELKLELCGLKDELKGRESGSAELTEEEALEKFSATLDVGCVHYERVF